jgi:outer membrane protein
VINRVVRTTGAVLALSAIATSANADTIFGLYAGGGVWNSSYDGDVGTDEVPITASELGLDSNNSNFFYVALEHPVPVLPNVRLAKTGISTDGSATVSREFTFEDLVVPADVNTETSLDLSHTDVTLYYELMDNYLSFDLGLTGRNFDSSASISYQSADDEAVNGSESVELKGTLPLLYTKLQVDLPFTGWYLGGSLNYISYDGDSFSDIDAKVGYMTDGLGLDVGFDLGYRQMKLTVEELDDLSADLSTDGAYASVFMHF